MVVLFTALLACSTGPSHEAETVGQVVKVSETTAGTIGGEPILPSPMIIGGIDNAVVETSIQAHMGPINRCFEQNRAANPELAGKVLVKFSIAMDGRVTNPSTRSTSLRDSATEECVKEEVAKVVFPPLERGRVAVVHYPFVFPSPSTN